MCISGYECIKGAEPCTKPVLERNLNYGIGNVRYQKKQAVSVTKKNMVKHYKSHSYSKYHITNVGYIHKWQLRNYPLIIWLIFPTNLLNIKKN